MSPSRRALSCFSSFISSMLSHPMSILQPVPRKRKRTSPEVYEVDDDSLISTKRPRTDHTRRQARHAARDRYWNTLSKVWLTPRALREFDRRNAAQSSERTSNLKTRPNTRSLVDVSSLSETLLKELKRFARRGGPELADIRGVGYILVF